MYGAVLPDDPDPHSPQHPDPDHLLGGGGYEQPIHQDYYTPNEVYKVKNKDDCHNVERTVHKVIPVIRKSMWLFDCYLIIRNLSTY